MSARPTSPRRFALPSSSACFGTATAALLAVVLAAAPCRANPADMFGFGSRAAAMGMAATAVTDDGAANFYNPAGLVRGKKIRVDLGYQFARPYLTLNGNDANVDRSGGASLALAVPGTLFGVRLAFGAAIYLPDDRLLRSRGLAYAQPRFFYYDNRSQRLLFTANLAVQLLPGLYLGAGLTFMSHSQGTVSLKGLITTLDTNDTSALTSSIDVDLVAVRYPSAGIVWEVNRYLTLAASYRHSFLLQLQQDFQINADVGNPGATPIIHNGTLSLDSLSSDLFQPWQLTFGGALRLTRRVLIAYDLVYAHWSEFPVPVGKYTLMLDVGPTFNKLVHISAPPDYPSPEFHDIVIPRLGIEVRALDHDKVKLDVRAGYSYEQSPAPEQIAEENLADCDKHRISAGLGLTLQNLSRILPGPVSLDGHLAVTVLPPRSNHKVDPTDPVGDYVAAGAIVEGGVTTRWSF